MTCPAFLKELGSGIASALGDIPFLRSFQKKEETTPHAPAETPVVMRHDHMLDDEGNPVAIFV